MIIKSKPDDFLNWLIRHRDDFAFLQGRLFDINRGESDHTAIVTARGPRTPREKVVTLVVTPLGDNLEIGFSAGQWSDLSSEFLDRLGNEIKKVWPGVYNDFVCYPADVIGKAQPGTTTTKPETAEDKRIAEIRAMNWQAMSDGEIGRKLILSDSRAKQLRLKGGMKRKKRTIGLS